MKKRLSRKAAKHAKKGNKQFSREAAKLAKDTKMEGLPLAAGRCKAFQFLDLNKPEIETCF
jgi:hypothetical protein